MSRKTILRITGLVLALGFGGVLGQLAGVLKATNNATVSTDTARALAVDEVAPSDNVIEEILSRLSPAKKSSAPASLSLLVAFDLVSRGSVLVTAYPLPPGILPSGQRTAS